MSYFEGRSKQVVCRKPHVCGWCGTRIEKGETVHFRSYLWHENNGWTEDWMHLECREAMQSVDAADIRDGWTPGDFLRGSVEWA